MAVWSIILVLGALAAGVLVSPCLRDGACGGGTVPGFAAGIVGFSFILLSLAYIARKQWMRISIWSLEQWLYLHVVLGTLSLAFIVAHSGFHLRNQPASLALLFLAVTVVSGAVGLAIFYFLPRSQARLEATIMIPSDLCRRLTRLNEELSEQCSGQGGVFLEVYNELVIPLFRTEVGQTPQDADVSPWAEKVAPGDQEDFFNLAVKIEMVHDLLVMLGQHMRFKWMIRAWLLVHVPATIGLVIFAFVHVIVITWLGVR